MSTLDTQIGELRAKVAILSMTYANMQTNGASEQDKLKTYGDIQDSNAILDNLLKIRQEQTANNQTILHSYTTATDALEKVNDLATQSAELASTIQNDTNTKKNAININTYYGKQYEEYKNLFILITIVSICMIASLSLSYTQFEYVSRPLTFAVGILGGTAIIYKMIEMLLRSNMDYDQYQWITAPITDDGIVNANNTGDKLIDISGVSLGTICVGPLCCGEGTEWVSKKGCVLIKPQTVSTTTTSTTAPSTPTL